MKIFILEDEINSYPRNQLKELAVKHDLTIATSAQQAMQTFRGPYDLLLLDHDMEGFYEKSEAPNTGYQFVKWLVAMESGRPHVILHSQNPVGRMKMRDLLHEHDFPVDECPFGPAYMKQLREQLL